MKAPDIMNENIKKWTELSLLLPEKLEPLLDSYLKSLGSVGNVSESAGFESMADINTAGINAIVLKGYLAGPVISNQKAVNLFKLFISQLKGYCTEEALGEVTVKEVDKTDWEKWKRFFKPVAISKRIVIKPSWEDYKKRPHELIVEIDPGMAFGTGTHESTRMCIKMLDDIIRGGESVLDVGTGSGILSIAAAKLGAKTVLAVDIDSEALKVAKENVRINGVDRTVKVSDLSIDLIEEEFDIIVANILAEDLILMREKLTSRLKQGGRIVLSGILKTKAQNVANAYTEDEVKLVEIMEDGDWSAILLAQSLN